MFKKAKLYLFLALIIASTIVGLARPPEPVAAQEADGVDSVLLEQTKSNIYKMLLYQCLDNFNPPSSDRGRDWSNKTINQLRGSDPIGNGDNSGSNSTDSTDSGWLAGYIVDSGDGKLSCKGDDGKKIIEAYKDATGYATPDDDKYKTDEGLATLHFFCTLGFRPSDEDQIQRNKDISNLAQMSVDDCVTAAQNDPGVHFYLPSNQAENGTLTDEMKYLAYRYTLTTACGASPSTSTVDSNRYPVAMVGMDGSGAKEDEWVDYKFPTNDTVSVFPGEKVKCRDIPGLMNALAAAYSNYRTSPENIDNESTSDGDPKVGGDGTSTCQINGVGWLVCPVMNFLGSVADIAYGMLEKLLILPPVNVDIDSASNGLYRAWKVMRDFANIAFVIAFLVIVFSQITNYGITNYGLKRLLPKLVICAILVNASYFLCAIAVDVSNILGSSLKSLLDNISEGVIPPDNENFLNGGSMFTDIVVASLAVGIGVAAVAGGIITLPLVLAAILFVIPIIVTVLVTMIVRQAAVVLLIFLAPLAFIALLLPNTEEYFKRWKQLFIAMLLIYPVIALVFGAGTLASAVLMAAAGGGEVQKTIEGVAAAAVRVVPLLLIPALVKISSGVLGKFTGIVNDKQKGLVDNARNTQLENHKYKQAEKAQERANNPTRRRGFDRFTPLGSSIRERKRKSRVAETESMFQNAYLGTEAGQAAEISAINAQKRLQGTQLDTETARLQAGSEGFGLEHETMLRERRKQAAENDARTAAETAMAGSRINQDLKESEIQKHTAELRSQTATLSAVPHALEALEKQAETEHKAAEDNSTAHALTTMAGTAGGQAALEQAENAKNSRAAAEKSASAVGLDGADRAIAGQAQTAELVNKIAENNLATGAANYVSPDVRREAYESDLTKQSVENRKEAAAIRAADNDTKVQAEASAELLGAAKNEVKEVYEEAVAGSPPAGVAGGSVAQAQAARMSSNVTGGRTEGAKRVSQSSSADRVLNDPVLAAQMGGVDPNGVLRQRAGAASVQSRANSEAVNNSMTLLQNENKPGTTEKRNSQDLLNIIQDSTQSSEMRQAATILLSKNGGDKQIMKMIDYLGVTSPATDSAIVDLQQQVGENLGSRKPPAIGEAAMDEFRSASFTGSVEKGWVKRSQDGKFGGANTATMSKDQLESLRDSLRGHIATVGGVPDPGLQELSRSINAFLTSPQNEGRLPPEEITNLMKEIATATAPPPVYGPPAPPASPPPVYGPPAPPSGMRPDEV